MDKQKIQDKLNKIQKLLDNLNVEEKIYSTSKIEKDLMLSYLRELYDLVLWTTSSNSDKNDEKKGTFVANVPQKEVVHTQKNITPEPKITTLPEAKTVKKEEPAILKIEVVEKAQKEELPKAQEVAKVIEQEKTSQKVVPPIIVPPVIEEEPSQVVVIDNTKQVSNNNEKKENIIEKPREEVKPKLSFLAEEESVNELFAADDTARDISAKLSQGYIADIKTVMGINERFLMTNELFGGNAGKFNEAIDNLNSFNSFEQAKIYIAKILVPQYDWLDKKKVKRAKEFISKVRRRYK